MTIRIARVWRLTDVDGRAKLDPFSWQHLSG